MSHSSGVPPKFTKSYESAEITWVTAGLQTLAHGLGVIPKMISIVAICKTAYSTFSVGEETPVGFKEGYGNTQYGNTIRSDATNIVMQHGTAFLAYYDAAGNIANMDSTKHKLIVRAWA
jgi:hypothetical protein